MSRTLRVTALVMLVLMISSVFCSYAMAANVCTKITGTVDQPAVEFTVKTNKKWLFASKYLTINFNKGVGYVEDTGKSKSTRSYWTVYVYDSKGELVQTKSSWGASSLKIKNLKRNSTYRIKVVEDRNMRIIGLRILRWKTKPSWYVGTTKNLTLCK